MKEKAEKKLDINSPDLSKDICVLKKKTFNYVDDLKKHL
jgi:hypothetical protein